MTPTATVFGKKIDCRTLCLEAHYYSIKKKDVLALSAYFYNFVDSNFSRGSFISWTANDRTLKNEACINDIITDGHFDLAFDGDIKSAIIHNKKTQKGFFDQVRNTVFKGDGHNPFFSDDYLVKRGAQMTSFELADSENKAKVVQLFNMEGMVNVNYYLRHDFEGWISGEAMPEDDELFEGMLTFRISCFCLGEKLPEKAGLLCEFASKVAERYVNINSVINIQQDDEDYERIMGVGSIMKMSFDDVPDEFMEVMNHRARYMYMQDVGWFNYLSPKAASLVIETLRTTDNKEFSFVEQKNGGAIVKSNKSIEDTLLSDLKIIKKAIYKAVIPTKMVYSFDWPLRYSWENVPVLDEEIKVCGDKVIIEHIGLADPMYLIKGAVGK